MPAGSRSPLFVHDFHAVFTDAVAPSARIWAATWSGTGSHTVNGSVTVSVAASEPADDHDHAFGASSATPASPRAAPSFSARLLLRFSIYLTTSSQERSGL